MHGFHFLLLVEDDADLLEIMSDHLRHLGFVVDGVSSLAAAIAALCTQSYSLVLTDRLGADWAAVDAIVQAARATPVGMISGYPLDEPEVSERCLAFSLLKPLELETLLTHIERATVARLDPAADRIVRAYFDRLSAADWNAVAALCADDVEYHLSGDSAKFSVTVRGRAQLLDLTIATFRDCRDARFKVDTVLSLPSGPLARFQSICGASAKGVDGSARFEISNGLVHRIDIRLDTALLR